MEECGNRFSCRNLFKKLQILPLTSQCMLSLLMFVVQKQKFFLTNSENSNLDTRQRNNLYLPQANLTVYQKGAYYLGIKVFNNVPLKIKNVAGNQKKTLKLIYYTFFHSFMSYGIIFWGNLSHSSIIFRIQKKAIRIMEGGGNSFVQKLV